jgi:hypothetical protein
MDLLEIGLNVVDWIGVAQDRYRWRALVNAVMNLPVRLQVTASVVPSSPILVNLMKKALSSSETSALTRATRRNIPVTAVKTPNRTLNPFLGPPFRGGGVRGYVPLSKYCTGNKNVPHLMAAGSDRLTAPNDRAGWWWGVEPLALRTRGKKGSEVE